MKQSKRKIVVFMMCLAMVFSAVSTTKFNTKAYETTTDPFYGQLLVDYYCDDNNVITGFKVNIIIENLDARVGLGNRDFSKNSCTFDTIELRSDNGDAGSVLIQETLKEESGRVVAVGDTFQTTENQNNTWATSYEFDIDVPSNFDYENYSTTLTAHIILTDGVNNYTLFLFEPFVSTVDGGDDDGGYEDILSLNPTVGADGTVTVVVKNTGEQSCSVYNYGAIYQNHKAFEEYMNLTPDDLNDGYYMPGDDIELKVSDGSAVAGTIIPAGGTVTLVGRIPTDEWYSLSDETQDKWFTSCFILGVYASADDGEDYFGNLEVYPDYCKVISKTLPSYVAYASNDDKILDPKDLEKYEVGTKEAAVSVETVQNACKNETVVVKDGKVVSITVGDKTYPVAACIDLSVYKKDKATGEKTAVSQTYKKLKYTFEIPAEFKGNGKEFVMLRVHEGKLEILPDLDSDPNTITFETDLFSLYMIAEKAPEATVTTTTEPTKKAVTNSPATGDNAPIALVLAMMVVTGSALFVMKKKED